MLYELRISNNDLRTRPALRHASGRAAGGTRNRDCRTSCGTVVLANGVTRYNEIMRKKFWIMAAVVFTLFLASCTSSKTGTGNLMITVTAGDGELLQGAKVVSNEQPAGQLKVNGLTDNTGTVTFNNIKSGDYDFYISRFDYDQLNNIEINVLPDKTTQYKAILKSTTNPAK
jgi:hypothetical protein